MNYSIWATSHKSVQLKMMKTLNTLHKSCRMQWKQEREKIWSQKQQTIMNSCWPTVWVTWTVTLKHGKKTPDTFLSSHNVTQCEWLTIWRLKTDLSRHWMKHAVRTLKGPILHFCTMLDNVYIKFLYFKKWVSFCRLIPVIWCPGFRF